MTKNDQMLLTADARAKARAKAKAKAKAASGRKPGRKPNANAKAKASAKSRAAKAKAKASEKAKAKAKASAKSRGRKRPACRGDLETEAVEEAAPPEAGSLPDVLGGDRRRAPRASKAQKISGLSDECREMDRNGQVPPTFGGRARPAGGSHWALEKYIRTAAAFKNSIEDTLAPGTKHKAQAGCGIIFCAFE